MIRKTYDVRGLALVFYILVIACSDLSASLDIPVYEGAHEVKKRKLEYGEAVQLTYKLTSPKTDEAPMQFYRDYFLALGWKECTQGEGAWQTFQDATGATDYTIRQLLHYFVNFEAGDMATVALRYRRLTETRKSPDKEEEIQRVIIIIQHGINVEREASRLSLECQSNGERPTEG